MIDSVVILRHGPGLTETVKSWEDVSLDDFEMMVLALNEGKKWLEHDYTISASFRSEPRKAKEEGE